MARYTWVVSPYRLATELSSPALKVGPSGSKERLRLDLVIKSGEEFRLLDGAGTTLYTGHILGEYTGHEPLDEFGRANDCTRILYHRGGRWVELAGKG